MNLMSGLSQTAAAAAALTPPTAERRPFRVEHHGVTLDDPYQWLRDPAYPVVQDPAILAQLEAENAYYNAVMAPLGPLVETLFTECRGRIKEDDRSVPVERHGFLYQWRFEPGAQYRKWYRRPLGVDREEQLVLDEPALAQGKDFFQLGLFAPSPDGRLLAFAADDTGSERFILQVKDLTTGAMLPLALPDMMDAVWSADSRVLLYTVLNAEWRPWQIRAHILGTDPAADRILYQEEDGGFRVSVAVAQSEALIFLQTGDHVTTEIRFVPAADPFADPITIQPRRPGLYLDADHDGQSLVLRVNDTHRNFRIVRAPVARPGSEHWQELIAGSDRHYLRRLVGFRRVLAIEERLDGLDQIRLIGTDGSERRVAFPDAAYTVRLGANPAPDPARLRLDYSSLVRPATVFDLDPATGALTTLKIQEIPSGYAADDHVALRLMAPSRDGAQIPISLVHRRDWRRGEGRPLHLYGYGAYGLGMVPSFSSNRVSLLDRGFAYAIAHIRGGDELGYGWYEDGKLAKRSNTFHDFIDAARFLIAEGYAVAGSISISGGSAGGQLMGAVANLAPALWRAIVAHVPFVDALNTMLDASLPLTPAEWPEWGDPITDPDAFALIRGYSPYDNVTAQDYPPTMVTAGLNDPRVTYWEPAKWVAKLRALKTGTAVLIAKTEMGAGHGGKSGRFERLHEVAEEYAFLIDCFGLAP
jgi:oligopeptidase B